MCRQFFHHRLRLTQLSLIGASLVAWSLSSCSWWLSPQLPAITQATSFNSMPADYPLIESLPYLAWWQQFNDPNLNQLIESGLKANLNLKIAASNLEQAQGQLKQIQLSWLPLVNLYAGYSSNPAFGGVGNFYGIWPQYTLNLVKLINQQRQAKYTVEASRAMVDGMRLTIIGQISASYFSLIGQQQQLYLLTQLAADLQKLISLSQQELAIGISDNIQLVQLQANYHQLQAQISQVQQNLVLSQNALRLLLNQNPGPIKTSQAFASYDFSRIKPGNLPVTVLANRPDFKLAANQVQAAAAGVGVATANIFPALQLDTFFGGSSGNNLPTTPSNYTNLNDAYLNWGINPATFGQIQAQQGAYQASVYQYIQTVRQIMREVDNAYAAQRYTSSSYHQLLQAWHALAQKYQLESNLYHTGLIDLPKLLQTKIKYDELALTANQAKLAQGLALVNLYQSLAGGYQLHPTESNI